MAITTNVFTKAYQSGFGQAVYDALNASGLFDSVTISSDVITCTKNSVALLIVNVANQSGANLITINNGAGDYPGQPISMVGTDLMHYCSVTTVGNAVFLIIRGSSAGGNTQTYAVTLCVDSMKDGSVGTVVCSYRRESTASPVYLSKSIVLLSENSLDKSQWGLNSPSSTQQTGAQLYIATASYRDGSIGEFNHLYGIRYSPMLYDYLTLGDTAAGVTPATVEVNDEVYLTDGLHMIKDDGGAS